MGVRRLASVLLLAALLSPMASAWTQAGGSAARTGAAAVAVDPLDVVSAFSFLQEGEAAQGRFTPAVASTPHGIVAWSQRGDEHAQDTTCRLVRIDDPRNGTLVEGPEEPCHGRASVVGYDEARDQVLLCQSSIHGDEWVLQARGVLDGKVRWDVVPARDFGPDAQPTPNPAVFYYWACYGAAIDAERGEAVVLFDSESLQVAAPHRLVSLSLADGSVNWVSRVPASTFAGADNPVEPSTLAFHPASATRTETGFVLNGILLSQPLATAAAGAASPRVRPALAWLDTDGRPVAGQVSDAAGGTVGNPDPGMSRYAAAQGPIAAAGMVGQVYLVNPGLDEPERIVRLDLEDNMTSYVPWAAPAWGPQTLVLPVHTTVTAFDVETMEKRWTWTKSRDWYVGDVVVAAPDRVLVVAGRNGGDGARALLATIDLGTGEVLQEVPLPISPKFLRFGGEVEQADPALRILPTREGVLVWSFHGEAAFLGAADPALQPNVTLSNQYPAPGEPVRLDIVPAAGAAVADVTVKWGSEAPKPLADASWSSHEFIETGDVPVLVTVRYEDGRTASVRHLLHVGGTPPPPPPQLSLMQRMMTTFTSKDNLDIFLGVVGLVASAGVGAAAIVARQRRRSRLSRALAHVDKLRASGEADAAQALRALTAFSARVQEEWRAGRWEEAAFDLLHRRAGEAIRLLRLRLLAPYDARLSPALRRRLELALEDAMLRAHESAELMAAVAAEPGLAPDERERLAALVASWQVEDAASPAT